MTQQPVMATVKGLVFIIDPEWEKNLYRRLTHFKTGAQIRSLQAEIYKNDTQAPQGVRFTETIIYTYYQFADGKTEMAKGYVADVGRQARKLYCECGVGFNWFPGLLPGQVGGDKTTCQDCLQRQADDADRLSPEEEDELVERFLEFRERAEEY